ncbi:MAG: EAL and HDOD domain-containing protein [Tuberibacillus sp.]
MEIFIARQPILNHKREIVAYELLYRSNMDNVFPKVDGDRATSDVVSSLLQMGFKEISEGKPCFVNFTENLINLDIPSYFQPDMLVIEVLETITFTEKLVESCRRLKSKGYRIALDDFDLPKNPDPFIFEMLHIADIVKVDVRAVSEERQKELVSILKQYDVTLLAEKVETVDEFDRCKDNHFELFQGYFFSHPDILSTQDVPVLGQFFYDIVNELSLEEPNIEKIAKLIEMDPVFSYKLLKFVNTPAFHFVYEIKSISQAIMILGLREFRKWIYVLSLREALSAKDLPNEIFKLCIIRAKMSESLALKKGLGVESSSCFLTGLFSLIHILLKQPLRKVMEELPLDSNIKFALLGFDSPYKEILDLVIAVEEAKWNDICRLADKAGIQCRDLNNIYRDTLVWTNTILKSSRALPAF